MQGLEQRRLLAVLFATSDDDSGPGTLRQLIADATAGDTIDLSRIDDAIFLDSQLTIDKSLTIAGRRAGTQLNRSGMNNTAHRIIEQSAGTVNYLDLTLQGGVLQADEGGNARIAGGTANFTRVSIVAGIASLAGGLVSDAGTTVNFTDCSIEGNQAVGQIASSAGGMRINGDSTIVRSFIGDNTATGIAPNNNFTNANAQGGGIVYDGTGTHTIVNSVFSANAARCTLPNGSVTDGEVIGGGIAVLGNVNLTITATTIAKSYLDGSTKIGVAVASFSQASVNIVDSILVIDNDRSADAALNWSGGSVSHSIVTSVIGSTLTTGTDGNIVGTTYEQMNFAPNVNNPTATSYAGGRIVTIPLLAGSPALDAGSSATTTDHRGQSVIGAARDIGAFEGIWDGNTGPAIVATGFELPYYVAFAQTLSFNSASSASIITAYNLPNGLTLEQTSATTAVVRGSVDKALFDDNVTFDIQIVDGVYRQISEIEIFVTAPAVATIGPDRTLYLALGTGNDFAKTWARRNGQLRTVVNGKIRNFNLAAVDRVRIYGNDGNDTISAGARSLPVVVFGGAGDDTITTGAGADTLWGEAGNDQINAGSGKNNIRGGDNNDTLTGGNTVDRIWGDGGNDTLVGRRKRDLLYGGAGDDIFIPGADAADRISDIA